MFDEDEQQALAELRHLWKLDNSAWMAERKSQWRVLAVDSFHEDTAKTIKKNGRYFIYGEKDEYIPSTTLYMLTPYDSISSAKAVFYSDLFGPHERSNIFSTYLDCLARQAGEMPWLKDHSIYFIDAIMGDTYRIVNDIADESESISPNPSTWAK